MSACAVAAAIPDGVTGKDKDAIWELYRGQYGIPAGQALLLAANDLIAFVPNAGFLGTVSLTAYAWDGAGMGNTHGQRVRAHGSDFSSTTLTATCLVNKAPTLTA